MRSVAGLVLAALAACGALSSAGAAVRRFVDVSERCPRYFETAELRGERLPFASDATVDWYLPFEDRHVTTPKGPVDVPRHARSIVGRFPTPKDLRTYVPSLKDN